MSEAASVPQPEVPTPPTPQVVGLEDAEEVEDQIADTYIEKADKLDTAREIQPLTFFEDDNSNIFDLRPVPVKADNTEVEPPSPKDSSAVASVNSSTSETTTEPHSEAVPEKTAPAEKANGKLKVSKSGTQTSSSRT